MDLLINSVLTKLFKAFRLTIIAMNSGTNVSTSKMNRNGEKTCMIILAIDFQVTFSCCNSISIEELQKK